VPRRWHGYCGGEANDYSELSERRLCIHQTGKEQDTSFYGQRGGRPPQRLRFVGFGPAGMLVIDAEAPGSWDTAAKRARRRAAPAVAPEPAGSPLRRAAAPPPPATATLLRPAPPRRRAPALSYPSGPCSRSHLELWRPPRRLAAMQAQAGSDGQQRALRRRRALPRRTAPPAPRARAVRRDVCKRGGAARRAKRRRPAAQPPLQRPGHGGRGRPRYPRNLAPPCRAAAPRRAPPPRRVLSRGVAERFAWRGGGGAPPRRRARLPAFSGRAATLASEAIRALERPLRRRGGAESPPHGAAARGLCCGDFRRGAVAARQLWRAPRPGNGAAISCCCIY